MKKTIFLIIFCLFVVSCSFPDNTTDSKIESSIQDQGEIQVFFCPHEDCETALVNFIDSAEESIHCALFDIGLQSIQDILDEKAESKIIKSNGKTKKIDVKIVTDNNYLKKYTRSFVKADKSGYQHNKFCIIDGKKISTGSMNPTNNGAHKNNNNLLLIDSKVLASNYEAEFQEMWQGIFKKGDPVLNPVIRLEITNAELIDSENFDSKTVALKNYFCPEDHCAEQVKEELRKAKESIYFMTFSFTHDGIANMILLKNQEGITIKGVMEARQVSTYSKFNLFQYQGIDVKKDTNPNNMHHKVFIIDNQTVITGSFNPTKSGNENNDENILIIHDEEIAIKYLQEFNYLLCRK